MHKVSIILLFTFIFSQFRDVPDIVTKVGTAAAPFLKLETGIREIGMAGAQAASGIGITSLPYNPAAIGFIEDKELFFNKTNYLAGISHNVFGYAQRLNSTDVAGIHVFYLDSGSMARTDYGGEQNGTFNVYDLAIRASFSKTLTDRLKVGFTAKYFREDIDNMYLQGFAADIGSNFDTGIYGFVLGMSVTNFGPEVRFKGDGLGNYDYSQGFVEDYEYDTQFFPLPMTFRLGVKNRIIGNNSSSLIKSESSRLDLAFDGIKSIDYTVYGCFGLEYAWNEIAFVRAGTHLEHDTQGASLGLGFSYNGIKFDYALVQYGILGSTGQFGIKLEL
tara:strand:- start:477 stop:1472 length:996 start_codon:yes stop_codon:yes gene_type:complete